jgi:hypothetical protein
VITISGGPEIEKILTAEFRARRTQYLKSKEELKLVKDVVSSILPGDFVGMLQQAEASHEAALQEYVKALREYSRFMAKATLPERFQKQV